eukprot:gnl/MRDRNA2_/MRDRNA2_105840_c0_seq1.p1 gnl/MRDRNA2_/MRDRNA2_105840_c0~~gnl/MRDRNA2_/MRDRNA2_105840_c0_seq1.p1  ORF type:complete len:266 (+),score=33.65 gnl/MRDRNA2_/MRDRNA2_105840_c0_seq1:58-855(+)
MSRLLANSPRIHIMTMPRLSLSVVTLLLTICSPCVAGTSDVWFWHQAFRPAVVAHAPEHLRLCAEVASVAANLPPKNAVVRQMLTEAADHLRRANVALLVEATKNSASKLHRSVPSTIGQSRDAFENAIQTFTAEGVMSTEDEVAQRLVDELSSELEAENKPAGLRGFVGANERPTDAVGECRQVSKLGFDVLKFDIRHDGVPKTPAAAQSLAKSLIAAAGETRRTWYQFMFHVDGLSSPWGAGGHFVASTTSTVDAPAAQTVIV